MTKSAKSADVFSFPTFDASAMTDQFREFAEKGAAQSKEAYAKMKDQVEATQKALEETFETARDNSAALALKAISAARANTESGFTHLEALLGVKSFAEVIELQTAFMRKQSELFADQAKELQSVATKAAEDASKPVKAAVEKAVKDLKVA